MTRVIAGRLKGRRLLVPDEGVRPTSDKVREAVFSSIQARLDLSRARVLDLFAGTGALGIEALSRGAEVATFVESNPATAKTLKKNIESLSLGDCTQIVVVKVDHFLSDVSASAPASAAAHASAPSFTSAPASVPRRENDTAFNLAFLDPPYDMESSEVDQVLAKLASHGWLAAGALVVVERPTKSARPIWPESITEQLHRTYGDTTIWYGEMCR